MSGGQGQQGITLQKYVFFYLSSKEKTASLSCRCKTRDFYLHLQIREAVFTIFSQ